MMKMVWIGFIALWSSTLLARPLVIKNIDKPIMISRKNSKFTISLPANATTGYQWVLVGDYNSALISPLKHCYHEHPQQVENKKVVGAPGYDIWTFAVKSLALKVPTTFTIKLVYVRAWELHPIKTVTLKLVTG